MAGCVSLFTLRLEDQTDLYCSATVSSAFRVARWSWVGLYVIIASTEGRPEERESCSGPSLSRQSRRSEQREVWEGAHWVSLRDGSCADVVRLSATELVCFLQSPHAQKGDCHGHDSRHGHTQRQFFIHTCMHPCRRTFIHSYIHSSVSLTRSARTSTVTHV